MSLQAKTQETREIRPRQKFEGHTHWVTGVIHLPGGQRMMTCSFDGSLRVWNSQSGKQIGNNWWDGEGGVSAIALSPDGTKVVCGTDDSGVLLWNIDTEKIIWTRQHVGDIEYVCWNRDGGRVVSGSIHGTARVWDVESGKTVLEIETGLSYVYAMICSPDTTMIAIGGYSFTMNSHVFLNIWDANTGKFITHLKGHTGDVNCLAWTADGKTLISGSSDSSIRTWNTTTWQQINVLTGHTSYVKGIALSPNGRILASASWDDTARLWDLENSQAIGTPLQHPYDVQCVSFSTDGKLLATGCIDNNAYSWDIAAIIREAGLDELLLNTNDGDKSLLNADATRHPRQRRDVHRIPERFFDDSPRARPPHVSCATRETTLSTSQHHSPRPTLLGHVSLLFRRTYQTTNDTTPRPRLLERARHPLPGTTHSRNDEDIEFQERRQIAVDVPLAQGHFRNYSARELLTKRKKEKEKAAAAKNASAGSSRPPQGTVQQSGGVAHAQPSSNLHLHVTVSTSSTTPAIASTTAVTTSMSSPPDVMILRAGRWTRFKLFICCVSAQTIDGHH